MSREGGRSPLSLSRDATALAKCPWLEVARAAISFTHSEHERERMECSRQNARKATPAHCHLPPGHFGTTVAPTGPFARNGTWACSPLLRQPMVQQPDMAPLTNWPEKEMPSWIALPEYFRAP
jgi:hypothetical protein